MLLGVGSHWVPTRGPWMDPPELHQPHKCQWGEDTGAAPPRLPPRGNHSFREVVSLPAPKGSQGWEPRSYTLNHGTREDSVGIQGERKEWAEPVTRGLATTLTPSTSCLPYILRCST